MYMINFKTEGDPNQNLKCYYNKPNNKELRSFSFWAADKR